MRLGFGWGLIIGAGGMYVYTRYMSGKSGTTRR